MDKTNTYRLNAKYESLLTECIDCMANFKGTFKRSLSPSTLAEIYATLYLDLEICKGTTSRGFDAKDLNGNRYQIKYRSGKNVIDLNNFEFDYILLVKLKNDYKLDGIWSLDRVEAEKLSSKREGKGYHRYQISQKNFLERAVKVV